MTDDPDKAPIPAHIVAPLSVGALRRAWPARRFVVHDPEAVPPTRLPGRPLVFAVGFFAGAILSWGVAAKLGQCDAVCNLLRALP